MKFDFFKSNIERNTAICVCISDLFIKGRGQESLEFLIIYIQAQGVR